jgi:hypothetical protein
VRVQETTLTQSFENLSVLAMQKKPEYMCDLRYSQTMQPDHESAEPLYPTLFALQFLAWPARYHGNTEKIHRTLFASGARLHLLPTGVGIRSRK